MRCRAVLRLSESDAAADRATPAAGRSPGCHVDKITLSAANRFGAREHGIRSHAREAFVDQMLVGLSAAERRRICAPVFPSLRLNEDETCGRQIDPTGGDMYQSPSNLSARPRIPDRHVTGCGLLDLGDERFDRRRPCLGFLSATNAAKRSRHYCDEAVTAPG